MGAGQDLLTTGVAFIGTTFGESCEYRYGSKTYAVTASINHVHIPSIGIGLADPDQKRPVQIVLPSTVATEPAVGGYITSNTSGRTFRITDVNNTGVCYLCNAEANR